MDKKDAPLTVYQKVIGTIIFVAFAVLLQMIAAIFTKDKFVQWLFSWVAINYALETIKRFKTESKL